MKNADAVVEVAVVTLPSGYEVCVAVDSEIIYRSQPFTDRAFALMLCKHVGEQADAFAKSGGHFRTAIEPKPLTELFVLYRDGKPCHIRQDRAVFDQWMKEAAWLYPSDRCEIVRFVPEAQSPS